MIRIGFVGDIALTHSYDALYQAKGPDYPFELVRGPLARHDVLVGNLEAPFCLGGETYPLKVSLRAHPGYAAGIGRAGFTALSLANNHILDYREQAFYHTIGLLDSQGIMHCGAGVCLEDAYRPAVIEKKGISIGILARCDVPIDSPFYASETSRGIAPLDLDQLAGAIKSLKGSVHVVAVYLHWGKEDWRYPSPEQVRAARAIIDTGADLVVGHHPHVLQGVERYHGGYIAYSLGNFLFSDLDWRWVSGEGKVIHSKLRPGRARRQSAIFSADVSESGVQAVTLTGCWTDHTLRAQVVSGRRLFGARMRTLSEPIAMNRYDAFWRLYDSVMTEWGRLKYQGRRVWKIHKIVPRLARKAREIASAPGMSGGETAGAAVKRSEPGNNHKARSGTTGEQACTASMDREDRAVRREQGADPPGRSVRTQTTGGRSRKKKKKAAAT